MSYRLQLRQNKLTTSRSIDIGLSLSSDDTHTHILKHFTKKIENDLFPLIKWNAIQARARAYTYYAGARLYHLSRAIQNAWQRKKNRVESSAEYNSFFLFN